MQLWMRSQRIIHPMGQQAIKMAASPIKNQTKHASFWTAKTHVEK